MNRIGLAIALGIGAVVGVVFGVYPQLDIAIANWFYDPAAAAPTVLNGSWLGGALIGPGELAAFPAANARILNRLSRNIGSGILVSMIPKAISSPTPPASPAITQGLPQPVALVPYGWMPYVIAASSTPNINP